MATRPSGVIERRFSTKSELTLNPLNVAMRVHFPSAIFSRYIPGCSPSSGAIFAINTDLESPDHLQKPQSAPNCFKVLQVFVPREKTTIRFGGFAIATMYFPSGDQEGT